MTERYEVCPVEELPPGERKIVNIGEQRFSIGVFNVDGEFYALRNVCPHQLAPLCEGKITGEVTADRAGTFERVREGEVLQCPWHGWKFNIKDGTSVFNPHKVRTRSYETTVEGPHGCMSEDREEHGTPLEGDAPPVDGYDVEVEDTVVVVYV